MAQIRYPRIQQTVGAFRFCKSMPRKKVTGTTSSEKMPSLSSCEEMQDILKKRKYGAVSSISV